MGYHLRGYPLPIDTPIIYQYKHPYEALPYLLRAPDGARSYRLQQLTYVHRSDRYALGNVYT